MQVVASTTSHGRDDFEISVVRLPEGIALWNLVCDFLALRKEVFIDEMRWDLTSTDSMEWEQYDNIDTVYVIAHREDEVIGGARLLRTDRAPGIGTLRYSYMIRDAYLGHLPGLPQDVCTSEPPVTPKAWELTRLVARNPRVGQALLTATNKFLKEHGAETCLFLGHLPFLRMARSMGYAPQPMGAATGNGSGRFIAFSCAVI
jgi:acyl homoserine lactone synthase